MLRNFKKSLSFSKIIFKLHLRTQNARITVGKIDKYVFDMLQYFNHTYCFKFTLFVFGNIVKTYWKIRITNYHVSNIEKLIMHLSIKKVLLF